MNARLQARLLAHSIDACTRSIAPRRVRRQDRRASFIVSGLLVAAALALVLL